MRLGSTWMTVTGMDAPSSAKTRVMPHLRPITPILISLSSVSAPTAIGQRGKVHSNQRPAGLPQRAEGSRGLYQPDAALQQANEGFLPIWQGDLASPWVLEAGLGLSRVSGGYPLGGQLCRFWD